MRSDARKNRQQLITAASEIMRTMGGDVPMEMIAERAGVTRGTLYRNFADRQAIYEAVLENDLNELADALTIESKKEPLAFIRLFAELMRVCDKFLISLADMHDYDKGKNEARMIEVINPYLAAAQKKKLIDRKITGTDILIVCRMLSSHSRLDGAVDPKSGFEHRFNLLMTGLGPA